MIPSEVSALRDALLGITTNSESQATRWAFEIIDKLKAANYQLTDMLEAVRLARHIGG